MHLAPTRRCGGAPVIPENVAFVLRDGTRLHSLRELARQLDTMPHETFSHHVTDQKNDFARWIEDVFQQAPLAANVRDVRDPASAAAVIRAHISRPRDTRSVEKTLAALMHR